MEGTLTLPVLYALIAVALAFDFLNGLHDAANSIATIVSTRVLRPQYAVLWAAFFNLFAAIALGTRVASSISKGYVDPKIVTPELVLAGPAGNSDHQRPFQESAPNCLKDSV